MQRANWWARTAWIVLMLFVGHASAFEPAPHAVRAFQLASPATSSQVVLSVHREDLFAAHAAGDSFVLERMPLPDGSPRDLVLTPFRVLPLDAKLVVVDGSGERPADFDPHAIANFRGHVSGVPGSHVFLSVAERSIIGRIELGAGRPTFRISSQIADRSAGGAELTRNQIVLYEASASPPGPTAPVLCGTGLHEGVGITPVGPAGEAPPESDGPDSPGLAPLDRGVAAGMRLARLAVDSDYEFFELFADEHAALAYLVQTYAQVSDLTVRDVRVRLDLVYLRLWTTPDDPYGAGASFPDLRSAPPFEIGQLMSGSKFASAGGQARVCAATSWVAYATGDSGDPTRPFNVSQDVRIAAHEIGHNLGSLHPHDYGVDECDDPTSRPRRGTLISYCAQTFSGGTSLTDPHFHTRIRQAIFGCALRGLVHDCNQNFVDDAIDLMTGVSLDANMNGIPDECEDCNANGTLDSEDIASGTSLDLNLNGVPDECEPDCNANGVPDDLDIAVSNSNDENGDGIPDECQADRDGNGRADWSDIFRDMSLDLDRDGVLDATQDCDGDGIMDIEALDHAHNLWAASTGDGRVKEYHYRSGVLRAQTGGNHLIDPVDVRITTDRRVLVADAGDATIAEFDRQGRFVRDLVMPGQGGLVAPSAMAFAPDGALLVADLATDSILRYDVQTGAFLGVFVQAGAGGLVDPYGMAFKPDGNLFVTADDTRVLEFDRHSGDFVGVFITDPPEPPVLREPRGILFVPGPGGVGLRCLVTFQYAFDGGIFEFDSETGAYLGQWNEGSLNRKLIDPWALRLGPDGNVYVSSANLHERASPPPAGLHLSRPHVFQYDGQSGKMIRAYVQGNDSGLDHPKGFDFMPGPLDRNANAIPDACESVCAGDCDRSGAVDLLDFLCFQNAFAAGDARADCTGDGVLDLFDFLCFQRAFDAGCP